MRYRTILLFGAPGAGKGTQGKILGSNPGFFHCACGDVFRSLTPDTPLGRVFLEYSRRGELVPDEQTVKLWCQYIVGVTHAGRFHPESDSLVLDGIPRCIRQAEILEETLDIESIIYLHCTQQQKLIERMQRRALRENRPDDAKLEVIENRLRTYEHETEPLLNFYGKDLVHRIDATQAIQEVSRHVLSSVTK